MPPLPSTGPILAPGVTRREAWGWAMYDFASSSYTTVVTTAVFNSYFVAVVAGGKPWATLAWVAALGVSNLLLIAGGPLLGAWADLRANKKPLLLAATAGCVASTAALALAGPGMLWPSMALLVVSSTFFGIGENLAAAFLPELASAGNEGKLSGWGWSLGYAGGLLALLLCLAYIAWAERHGQHAAQYVPVTMLITAVLYGVASVPTFVLLRERAQPQASSAGGPAQAIARLRQSWRRARRYTDLRRFLLCIAVYQAGIQAVIALAAIYARQAMGFSTRDTVLLIIVVNATAAAGAFAFGYVQDRIGHVATIAATLAGWIAMTLMAALAQGPLLFWIAANIAGLCLGASQSAARAFIGVLSPAARRAEFFGLWGMAVRVASIAGPLTYGVAGLVSGGNHRLALLITGLYFVAGLLLLTGIDAARGMRAANADPLSVRK